MYSNTNPTAQYRAIRYRQRFLGKKLDRIYGEVTGEPIPASFTALLETADSKLLPQLRTASPPSPLKEGITPPLQKQRSKLSLFS